MATVPKGLPAIAYAVWEDDEGGVQDPGGTLSVTVRDDLGADYGTAPVTVDPSGMASVQLPTQAVAEVGRLVLTWTGGPYPLETTVDVAGGSYVTLGGLRSMRNLSDPRFTRQQLLAALETAETLVESYCGVAFVGRYERERVDGYADGYLEVSRLYPQRPLSAIVGDETAPLDGWHPIDGAAFSTGPWCAPAGLRNVDLAYVYGRSGPVPADLAHAAATIVQELVIGSLDGLPDRATSLTTDGVTYSIAQAGPNRPTGIPTVDATLNRYREQEVRAV